MACYGSDFRGCIDYTFNNQGFRSDFDYTLDDPDKLLVCMGSSIATAHGLEVHQGFGYLVAQELNNKLWNLGQGCFRSSNQTILEQVEFLNQTQLNIEHWVIQFTHINRMGNKFNSHIELDQASNIQNFCSILSSIEQELDGQRWCWMLADYSQAEFPSWVINHPHKITIDPDSVDFVAVDAYRHLAPNETSLRNLSLHPGPQWNRNIADMILNYFHEHP